MTHRAAGRFAFACFSAALVAAVVFVRPVAILSSQDAQRNPPDPATAEVGTDGNEGALEQQTTAVDYNRDIRPILSDVCFLCHGPDEGVRQTSFRLDVRESALGDADSGGKVIVPGDSTASVLMQRVTAEESYMRMPPEDSGKTLTPEQVELLRRWIDEGATWKEHWSFVKPERPKLPEVSDASWPRNPIDSFVLSRLDETGLSPEAQADKETLIRRVTYDLTGLPPTLAEIDAFLADDAPDAYSRLVERLLNSPSYGEHQARFWLDAARYGDTHGLHLDNERSLWPYRDWVVNAFNRNQPFDQFTVEQLAGDLLPKPSLDQLIATGFNRCNVTTSEGGSINEEYLVRYAVDRVETTSTVFMGLTVGCAVCHDHKFDPISQREFYSLFAFYNSLTEKAMDGNAILPPPSIKAPDEAAQQKLAEFDQQITALAEQLEAPMPEVDAAQQKWQTELASRLGDQWNIVDASEFTSTAGATLRKLDDLSILAEGENPAKDTYEILVDVTEGPITAIRLEALLDDSLNGKGPGRSANGNFVLSEFELDVVSAAEAAAGVHPENATEGSNEAQSYEPQAYEPQANKEDGDESDSDSISFISAAADHSQTDGGYVIEKAIDGVVDQGQNGWAVEGHRRHEARAAIFIPAEPIEITEPTRLRIRLRHESQFEAHAIGRFRLAVSRDESFTKSALSPWSMLGPILVGSDAEGFETVYAPEQGVDLNAKVGDLAWAERADFVDDKVHYLTGEIAVTYLYRTIDAPSPRKMSLSLGSDDGIKVWVNGQLAHQNFIKRGVGPGQDRVEINLRGGRNEILMKIVNFGGGYGFYFQPEREKIGEATLVLGPILRTPEESRSGADAKKLRDYFRRNDSPEWAAMQDELTAVKTSRQEFDATIPSSMIMKEMDKPRPAHLLNRGQYDQPGEEVQRGTPATLPMLVSTEATPDRLDLARWLVDPGHPLTARVTVNRFWQQYFGTGIVRTAEDFGSQGEWPSHPELLDWLATEFIDSGWDVKNMQRLIVTSAAYRQSSMPTPEKLAADPANRLISRGPRFRLAAEAIRDTALSVSGLLVQRMGGKSVKPYQPPGIWEVVGYTDSNTAKFQRDTGLALYRRSLYTFLKRTAPPPSMLTFDAPSRESCTVRRQRTNTPLQALVLLNDEQFVEAARKFAERIVHEGGDNMEDRVAFAFRTVTGRFATQQELAIVRQCYTTNLEHFTHNPGAAGELLKVGDAPANESIAPPELAAWTMVANLLLNLSETITKG